MGLRCSILGHTFDETEVRRDRRERGSGNEVVTVVSQVERCSRCGTERVVSENKEVVSVVDADEVGIEEDEVEHADPRADPSETDEPDAVSRDDLAASLGSDPDAGTAPDEEPEASAEPEPDSDPDRPADPSEEDVEFITETEGSLGGSEDVAGDEDVPADAGDASGGIGGMAARSGAFDGDEGGSGGSGDEEAADDAEILDAPEVESERAPGQWPDEPDGSDPWEPDTLEEREDDSGSASEPEPDVEPVGESSFTVPEGSLRCPNCGHEVSAASSFRAGDACPECQTGYLESAEGE